MDDDAEVKLIEKEGEETEVGIPIAVYLLPNAFSMKVLSVYVNDGILCVDVEN